MPFDVCLPGFRDVAKELPISDLGQGLATFHHHLRGLCRHRDVGIEPGEIVSFLCGEHRRSLGGEKIHPSHAFFIGVSATSGTGLGRPVPAMPPMPIMPAAPPAPAVGVITQATT
jgi:hypothetical protein